MASIFIVIVTLVYTSVIPCALAALLHEVMLSFLHNSEILQDACEAALKDWKYDSEGTRQMMSQRLQDTFDRNSPYAWQLDAAEALILRLDCIVIAETGAGKTIPFVLPLFLPDS